METNFQMQVRWVRAMINRLGWIIPNSHASSKPQWLIFIHDIMEEENILTRVVPNWKGKMATYGYAAKSNNFAWKWTRSSKIKCILKAWNQWKICFSPRNLVAFINISKWYNLCLWHMHDSNTNTSSEHIWMHLSNKLNIHDIAAWDVYSQLIDLTRF